MSDVPEVYAIHLSSTSKLKMNALGKLAEGTPAAVFGACVLLHEAARGERRAVESLPAASSVTRLASAIEECWCLIEGRDPPAAAQAWGQVLAAVDQVDRAVHAPMLARLSPLYAATRNDFAKRLGKPATHDILYRSGLGALAAGMQKGRASLEKTIVDVVAELAA